jgi:hypothetical protein
VRRASSRSARPRGDAREELENLAAARRLPVRDDAHVGRLVTSSARVHPVGHELVYSRVQRPVGAPRTREVVVDETACQRPRELCAPIEPPLDDDDPLRGRTRASSALEELERADTAGCVGSEQQRNLAPGLLEIRERLIRVGEGLDLVVGRIPPRQRAGQLRELDRIRVDDDEYGTGRRHATLSHASRPPLQVRLRPAGPAASRVGHDLSAQYCSASRSIRSSRS